MGTFSILFTLTLVVLGSYADSIIPGRKHNILVDSNYNGAFDLFFNTEKGAKVGCRGNIANAKENLQEIYLEDTAGLLRNGKTKNSQLRLLVVPRSSRDSSNSSIEALGLANFALWPRECILGLIQLHPEDLLAEESHEDVKTGVVEKTSYLVTGESAGSGWWRKYPESEITDDLVSRFCRKGGGGCQCRIGMDGSLVGRGVGLGVGVGLRGDEDGGLLGGGGGCSEPGDGACGPCSACSSCAAWGPVVGGSGNQLVCTYIDIYVTKPDPAPVTRTTPPGSDPSSSVTISVGGGGGDANGGSAISPAAGNGGNVLGAVIGGIHIDGNSGISSCNDDDFSINGIQYDGGTNSGGKKVRAGRYTKLI